MTSLARGQRVSVALIVVAVGVIVAYVATRQRVTTSERDARSFNLLQAYREDDITGVTLEKNGARLVLERQPPDDAGTIGWNIREPVKEEADAYAVDKLLGSLEYARPIRRIKSEEVDKKAFGLDAPEWRMTVSMGAIHYTLMVGKEAASPAGSHYLELQAEGAPGAGVMIVSRDLVKELDVDVGELRGRQMLPYTSDALRSIVIKGTDGSERRFVSAGHDRWRFRGMEHDLRVSRDAFDQVLVQFARTKAEHFMAPKDAEEGLKSGSVVSITLVPTDDKQPKAVIDVGGRCPTSENDVVALRREPDPVAACVPKSVLPGLDTSADELVDRHPFSLRKDEVESLEIVRGNQKLSLDRKENGFVLRAPAKGEVELEAGNRRVESIVRADGEIVAEPDLKALGLDPPAGHATVRSSADTDASVIEESVELGKRDKDGKLPIRRRADGAVLLCDADAARAFEPDSTLIRSLRILDFSLAEFRSVDISGKTLHQKFHREGSGQFALDLPKDFEHDAGLASALVDALGTLSADRWAADRDDGNFGLADPQLRATLSVAAGDGGVVNHVLSVGALTAGGAFAKLDGEPGVFVIPRKVVDDLGTWVIDRSVFMVTPDNASQVELERHGKKLVLAKKGSTFSWSDGIEVPATRVSEIADELIALRAEAAVRVGPPAPGEGLTKPELVVRIDGKEKFRIGAGDSWQGTSVYYARAAGVSASYVIAKSKVRVLLDAF
jgi:Domain of unknown function (DUF4340)